LVVRYTYRHCRRCLVSRDICDADDNAVRAVAGRPISVRIGRRAIHERRANGEQQSRSGRADHRISSVDGVRIEGQSFFRLLSQSNEAPRNSSERKPTGDLLYDAWRANVAQRTEALAPRSWPRLGRMRQQGRGSEPEIQRGQAEGAGERRGARRRRCRRRRRSPRDCGSRLRRRAASTRRLLVGACSMMCESSSRRLDR
jgi:hypothetical protein